MDKISKLKILSEMFKKELDEKNKKDLRRKNALVAYRSKQSFEKLSPLSPLKKRKKPPHLFGRKEKEMNLYVEYVKEKTSVFNIQKEYEDANRNKTQFEECLQK